MNTHLTREIDRLNKSLLELSGVVEEAVWKATLAVKERDVTKAREVIEHDRDIDQREVDLEEECLKILALHQPVAIDLRLIVAALKMNNDLERIGDLSVNIAERALLLADMQEIQIPFDLTRMAEAARNMVRKSLDSLVQRDPDLAFEVCGDDNEIDDLYQEAFRSVKEKIVKESAFVEQYLSVLSIARHLERIGDHATNIAEDVIYMTGGEIVRHYSKNKARKAVNKALESE